MFDFKFKSVAKKLSLKDTGKVKTGNKTCLDCGGELRYGKDKRNYTVKYCPNCRKIINVVFSSREPPILSLSCED